MGIKSNHSESRYELRRKVFTIVIEVLMRRHSRAYHDNGRRNSCLRISKTKSSITNSINMLNRKNRSRNEVVNQDKLRERNSRWRLNSKERMKPNTVVRRSKCLQHSSLTDWRSFWPKPEVSTHLRMMADIKSILKHRPRHRQIVKKRCRRPQSITRIRIQVKSAVIRIRTERQSLSLKATISWMKVNLEINLRNNWSNLQLWSRLRMYQSRTIKNNRRRSIKCHHRVILQ